MFSLYGGTIVIFFCFYMGIPRTEEKIELIDNISKVAFHPIEKKTNKYKPYKMYVSMKILSSLDLNPINCPPNASQFS